MINLTNLPTNPPPSAQELYEGVLRVVASLFTICVQCWNFISNYFLGIISVFIVASFVVYIFEQINGTNGSADDKSIKFK